MTAAAPVAIFVVGMLVSVPIHGGGPSSARDADPRSRRGAPRVDAQARDGAGGELALTTDGDLSLRLADRYPAASC